MVDKQRRDDVSTIGDNPLYRRLHRDSASVRPGRGTSSTPSDASPEPARGIATLQLLNGTIIARMGCDPDDGVIVLGRGSMSDVRISDPYVHRSHAEIHWDPTTRSHILSHCGGENGSWVNLQRVGSPVRLTDGARVRVGKTELIYRRAQS